MIMLFVFGVIFLALTFCLYEILVGYWSLKWPSITGEVIGIKEFNDSLPGRVFYPVYSYSLNEKVYVSIRISFNIEHFSSFDNNKQEVLSKYPKGKKVVVYYNPYFNGISVLDPGIKANVLVMLLFLIIALIFIILIKLEL